MVLTPDVIANLRFLLVSEGGRSTATPSDHLGCIFEYEGESFECRLLLEDTGPISPGGRATVPIKFLRPELIKQRLHPGSRFNLREDRMIAEGTIATTVE
jgi:hypothetical protein